MAAHLGLKHVCAWRVREDQATSGRCDPDQLSIMPATVGSILDSEISQGGTPRDRRGQLPPKASAGAGGRRAGWPFQQTEWTESLCTGWQTI